MIGFPIFINDNIYTYYTGQLFHPDWKESDVIERFIWTVPPGVNKMLIKEAIIEEEIIE